jgi:hypothetical protein
MTPVALRPHTFQCAAPSVDSSSARLSAVGCAEALRILLECDFAAIFTGYKVLGASVLKLCLRLITSFVLNQAPDKTVFGLEIFPIHRV